MSTRFQLFVQPPSSDPGARPEVVTVSSPAGSVAPGPADHRMYVVEPIGKEKPFGRVRGPFGTPYVYLPPWGGAARAPAMPDAEGHFDHLAPGMPGFEAAHLFGAVRFTLDVWERYLGGPFHWHFAGHIERLEISLLHHWDNAQYGFGFLETGSQFEDDGTVQPFSLNFDVVAHEIGHAIIYSLIGVPDPRTELPEYLGFQESAADCVSIIAAMHFPSVLREVLEATRGNLYQFNRLARISEYSRTRQMRLANNSLTMARFARGWDDEHDLAQPLTGAVFDILVDIFHESLVAGGAISPAVEDLADRAENDPELRPVLQAEFDRAYERDPAGFLTALEDARDLTGVFLADSFKRMEANYLDYDDLGNALLAIDMEENDGAFSRLIRRNFERRLIGTVDAGPRLKAPDKRSHTRSARTVLPDDQDALPGMSYRERYLLARSGR